MRLFGTPKSGPKSHESIFSMRNTQGTGCWPTSKKTIRLGLSMWGDRQAIHCRRHAFLALVIFGVFTSIVVASPSGYLISLPSPNPSVKDRWLYCGTSECHMATLWVEKFMEGIAAASSIVESWRRVGPSGALEAAAALQA